MRDAGGTWFYRCDDSGAGRDGRKSSPGRKDSSCKGRETAENTVQMTLAVVYHSSA